MSAKMWWVDEGRVIASGNPTDADLARLRSDGFNTAFSFLSNEETAQFSGAALANWSLYEIPIREGKAPSLEQIGSFIEHLAEAPTGLRVLMFCQSGLGRSACMGAAYWIAKGLAADEAIRRIEHRCGDSTWKTPERLTVLHEYAQKSVVNG